MASFVHLHVHSEYSIIDGIIQVKNLCQAVHKRSMPAVALTDICNLFGMVKFYKAALQQGLKPIIGAELWVAKDKDYHKLILLCQNQQGYANLTKLISQAYQQGKRLNVPLIEKEWIAPFSEGLIALSGAQGAIGHALINQAYDDAQVLLKEWTTLFPNRFYLTLQRNRAVNNLYEKQLFYLANQLNCPVVATNDVVFLNQSDFEAHNARVCIQQGITLEQMDSSPYSEEQYLKTPEEMRKLFQDIPRALDNTIEVAKRCNFSLVLDQFILPSFPVPQTLDEDGYLQQAAQQGLEKRLTFKFQNSPPEVKERYTQRLSQELSVIRSMGFSGYFLIVADFIQWAKSNHIPVGPGRGSGAGSLVAYALAITDLDPMDYDLLFERFLNPERISMPDFDIDFCMDNRDKVIDYVVQRYGRDNVSQIATFGTMAAKAVVRDVGRVLGYPYGFVDKIAKLIPFELGITLDKALEQEVILKKRYQEEEEVKYLLDLARKLEGIARSVGKHAGGVVIAPSALTDFAPLYCEQDNPQAVIQFDKNDVEAIGLVKFDFLGLRTLTIIDWAINNVNQLLAKKNQPPLHVHDIPLQDQKTFDLLKKCNTTAVFQLESRGMKELIKRLQPDHFEEIIALVALFRPGPLQSGMVDDFINRKHGRAKVVYPHAAVEPLLKPTYGVILYQEQVMQIAQILAGYTLGGADLLRRAMGKKKVEEMAKQRSIFINGALERNVTKEQANHIFDLIEKFADYGFNKSHSAAYALVSYQTAWLKAHYPSAFMAAVLSSDMAHTDKVVNFIEECKLCQIKVIPPDIHQSEYFFTVNEKDEIIYGLGAIKGLGEAAINHLIEKRKVVPFRDLFDFCQRIDQRKLNKRALEALIKSGTLDCLGERAMLLATLDEALQRAEQLVNNCLHGQVDLFQELTEEVKQLNHNSWTLKERLLAEKESLGLYFSGHPIHEVEAELTQMGVKKFKQIISNQNKVRIAGLIVNLRTVQTRAGDRMAIATLDDGCDRFEITIFPDPYQTYRELLVKDQLIIVEGASVLDNFNDIRIKVQSVYSLGLAQEKFVKKVIICINAEQVPSFSMIELKKQLSLQSRGQCPLYIEYQKDKVLTLIRLAQQWNILPTQHLINQIREMFKGQVKLEYNN